MSSNHWADNCDDDKIDNKSCEKSACKSFNVSVPVTISPKAKPRKPTVKCIREMEITPGHKRCKGKKSKLEFTISQKMNIDLPIEYGAEVCFSEACSTSEGKCERPKDND
ncbi:MAG: hypothetical protein FWE11_02475 [Defluviitaleaceae bacterium]|nr:hypothetical protein [Defluviitaleaceae bacterium]